MASSPASTQKLVERKQCKHCGLRKQLADFNRASNTRDGLQSWCRDCKNKRKKEVRVLKPTPDYLKNKICAVEGCDLKRATREWCTKHYTRWLNHGDPLLTVYRPRTKFSETPRLCAVSGCDRERVRRLWCFKHYKREWRYGDPEAVKRAPSNPGKTPEVKRAYVRSYKVEHGCVDCGYNQHHVALDFDHRPGTVKVRDIRSGTSFGWDALLIEISKCDVVCANCHRVRTHERRREVMPDGRK